MKTIIKRAVVAMAMIAFGTASAHAQTPTAKKMYVMKDNMIVYQVAVADIDSIIFYEKGVLINGVRWATSNVDAFGTFASTPESAGKLYQWNRATAWSATEETVSGWNSGDASGETWEKAKDPSPEGWRLPTSTEQQTLLDATKVDKLWITLNGVDGMQFTDKTNGNSIFLPAVGKRYNGTLSSLDSGNYWSSTPNMIGSSYSCALIFLNIGADWSNYSFRSNGFSVRSVAEQQISN